MPASKVTEREAWFCQAAGVLADATALVDRSSGEVVCASPGFESMFGSAPNEQTGESCPWVLGDGAERHESDQTPLERLCQLSLRDGAARWFRVRRCPLQRVDGRPELDLIVLHDVTCEQQLKEELGQLQKMEALGSFARGIVHDYNHVLQAALGCINVALREELHSNRARAHLEDAAEILASGGKLARQIMSFVDGRKTNTSAIDIDAVVVEAADFIRSLMPGGIDVRLQPRARGARLRADPIQIEQILLNLATNARDAMQGKGTLSIGTDVITISEPQRWPGMPARGRVVRITVEDTGSGMDDATRRRIFEPFFTTKAHEGGKGVGMSSVLAVTRDLGGQVEVCSEEGTGSAITVYLPCLFEEQAAPPRAS